MIAEEMEAAIVALQAEVEELQERVADLEMRVARPHNCWIDLCDPGVSGECRLRHHEEDQ